MGVVNQIGPFDFETDAKNSVKKPRPSFRSAPFWACHGIVRLRVKQLEVLIAKLSGDDVEELHSVNYRQILVGVCSGFGPNFVRDFAQGLIG